MSVAFEVLTHAKPWACRYLPSYVPTYLQRLDFERMNEWWLANDLQFLTFMGF